jgi:hypothetical protein
VSLRAGEFQGAGKAGSKQPSVEFENEHCSRNAAWKVDFSAACLAAEVKLLWGTT